MCVIDVIEDCFSESDVLRRVFYWSSEFHAILHGEKVASVMLDWNI